MPRPEEKRRAARKTGAAKAPLKQAVKRNPPSDFLTLRKGARDIKPVEFEKEIPYPIKNKENNVLVGVLHEPKRKSGTLVIAVHGFKSNKERPGIKLVCTEIARAGYAAYRFDLSGHGDSEGRFEDATPRKLLNDLDAVIDHFRPRYARIVLYGRSMGGWLSILVASTRKVDGLIIGAAPARWEQHFEKQLTEAQREQLRSVGFTTIVQRTPYGEFPLTLRDTFLHEMRQLHPLDAARSIACPVLIIHGTADTVIPDQDAREYFAALSHRELFLVGGADHRFSKPEHHDALVARIIEWLAQ